MSPFLLNLRLHDSGKGRVMESFSSLLTNNVFKDVLLVCSDGNISLDKFCVGLIFPFLSDIFDKSCSSDMVILLPDLEKNTIFVKISVILGTDYIQGSSHEISQESINISENKDIKHEPESLNEFKTINDYPSENIEIMIQEIDPNATINNAEDSIEKNVNNDDEQQIKFTDTSNNMRTSLENYVQQDNIEQRRVDNNVLIDPLYTIPRDQSDHFVDMKKTSKEEHNLINLTVGMTFVGKAEVLSHIKSYSNSNFSPLVIRNSSKTTKKSLWRLYFACPHGVKKISKSTGKRKVEATAYVGCPAVLFVNQKEDGTFVVDKAVLEHENHEVGREIFARYANNRRLSKDQEDAVAAFLVSNPRPADVASLLKDLTGRHYSTQDASNLVIRLRKTNSTLNAMNKTYYEGLVYSCDKCNFKAKRPLDLKIHFKLLHSMFSQNKKT